MEKKYQIFISSTAVDLKEEREKVRDAILKMNHFPVGMELFSASHDEQWHVIQRFIDSSDYVVLILAHRYGSITKDESGAEISYTEKEFRYAKSKGIPVHCFLISDSVKVSPDQIEWEHKEQLHALKAEIKQEKNVLFWHSAEELAFQVTTSLYHAFSEYPRPGWMRGDRTVKLTAGYEKLSWDEFYGHVYCLVEKLKQSESLGGFDFDIVVGISRGGTSVADLMAREFGQNTPILSLYAYRNNGKTSFSFPGSIISNEYILDILKQDSLQRILVVDSFTRTHGTSILAAKEYLTQNLPGKTIKTAVVYVEEALRDKPRIIKKIDYIGAYVALGGKKLSLE